MAPELMYSLASFVIGALIRHFWPTAQIPGTSAAPKLLTGTHPLLNSLTAQLNHFLVNPPAPTVPGQPPAPASTSANAFLTMLAGMLNSSMSAPAPPPAK